MAEMAEIDAYDVKQAISTVNSDFAESYLKPISQSLGQSLLLGISSNLTQRITQFLKSYQKELRTLPNVLGKYKTYRRYARYSSGLKDQSERLSFILAKPDEIAEMYRSKGSRRAWLVGCLMMKTYFVIFHSKLLLENIGKIPTDTATKYVFIKEEKETLTKYKMMSIFEMIERMIGVLDNAVGEYFSIKADLLQMLGLLDTYHPPTIFPTHWEVELARTHSDIIQGDDSAIYHVRTALELMLQITFRYFDDSLLERHARQVTTIRVAEACKKVGIKLPISLDLIERINHYSNLSLHRGKRPPFSDVWHMLSVLVGVSEEMKKLKVTDEQSRELKRELRASLQIGE
jgi:hypothetical protein